MLGPSYNYAGGHLSDWYFIWKKIYYNNFYIEIESFYVEKVQHLNDTIVDHMVIQQLTQLSCLVDS